MKISFLKKYLISALTLAGTCFGINILGMKTCIPYSYNGVIDEDKNELYEDNMGGIVKIQHNTVSEKIMLITKNDTSFWVKSAYDDPTVVEYRDLRLYKSLELKPKEINHTTAQLSDKQKISLENNHVVLTYAGNKKKQIYNLEGLSRLRFLPQQTLLAISCGNATRCTISPMEKSVAILTKGLNEPFKRLWIYNAIDFKINNEDHQQDNLLELQKNGKFIDLEFKLEN